MYAALESRAQPGADERQGLLEAGRGPKDSGGTSLAAAAAAINSAAAAAIISAIVRRSQPSVPSLGEILGIIRTAYFQIRVVMMVSPKIAFAAPDAVFGDGLFVLFTGHTPLGQPSQFCTDMCMSAGFFLSSPEVICFRSQGQRR